MSKTNLFTEEKYNALYQALEECAKKEDKSLDEYLCVMHKSAIVRCLVDKLEELGYIIVPIKKKCEWLPCDREAKYVETSGDGRLVNVCLAHRKLLRIQKQGNNNC